MAHKYYYVIHVQINEKYDYSVAVSNDRHLDENDDEQEIIKLATMGNFFEEDLDRYAVDLVYEITEEEYNDFVM